MICGKSGSGKTTLLNILGGLDCQTSGDIIVDGEKPEKKDLGSIGELHAGSIPVIRTNSNVMEVVEEIPKVVEAEPLTQKEIGAIAFPKAFTLLPHRLVPNCDNLQIGSSGSLD